MKKSLLLVLAMALLVMLEVSSFSPVSAALSPGTYTDHQNATGQTMIDIAGHPKIVIAGFHYDYGDLGSGDVIRIFRYVTGFKLPNGTAVDTWIAVAVFTDIPRRLELFKILYRYYTSLQLISDPSAIEVVREGNSKNIHVVWKTPLVVPDEQWGPPNFVPGFTLYPGKIVFRGHGDLLSGVEGAGTVQTVTWSGYYGNATFVCPMWEFGGPVGVNEGPYRTFIRIDSTIVTVVT